MDMNENELILECTHLTILKEYSMELGIPEFGISNFIHP